MKPVATRLVLTAALFFAWLGYLGYLVVCRPHTPGGLRGAFEGRPLTLSRPQFLVSMLDVVAEVSGDKGDKVVVKEVLFPKSAAPVKPGEEIQVADIDRWRPSDSSGPGLYLLPLQPLDANETRRFALVPIPPSPGFPPTLSVSAGPPRIYPATPEMLAEYRQIDKPQ